ncbi:Zn-dependent exopeptidase [Patellaria atrata CBS 101060]|uniref:Peptide hydrolase n=1 Tax=Patellaria atrata CBS 101060 TaxID=1346257 RepID=A0A9P4SCP3_9PEZI|nr:Zn-dependent exopeptidase [Patellaria atrata CBS 101060]
MRSICYILVLLVAVVCGTATVDSKYGPGFPDLIGRSQKKLVDSKKLQKSIKLKSLLKHAQVLEDQAYATPARNRLTGTAAHNNTIKYIYRTLKALNYYNVELQNWGDTISAGGNGSFVANGVDQGATHMEYGPNGTVTGTLVLANNVGCNITDFPAEVEGSIALVRRGSCDFGIKAAYARAAGAIGAIIFNNIPGGPIGGATLGVPPRPEGPYPPTLMIGLEQGEALTALINSGTNVTGTLDVTSYYSWVGTHNVIATSKGGDQDNIIFTGAHTDSVVAGPGINDNGSGSVGNLEVAIQLAKYKVKNAVRFGFWSGEEEGLLGAKYYIKTLPVEEQAKIRLYLNFDMIASPNYVYGIYDGDGSAFNLSGPPGSAEAEVLFEKYYTDRDLPSVPSAFTGRSDYGPFLDVDIASGGLFTGAEVVKTPEEAAMFGGEAGVAYDVNYHKAGDNMTNLNKEAFLVNAQAIAHVIATYARSFESLPPRRRMGKR